VFVTLIIQSGLDGNNVRASQVHFVPIEFLSWTCLRIGALGLGQIQIKNANIIEIAQDSPRREWMLALCDQVAAYHKAESAKIERQREFFSGVRVFWENKH
jgi:hypothetical protein